MFSGKVRVRRPGLSVRRPGLLAPALFAMVCAVMAAQTPPQQAPQPQRPVFRSSVQTIEVDVRVFDKDGTFVSDLKQEDFEVLEDGVPQPVQTVFIVESESPRRPSSPSGPSSPSSPSSPSALPVIAARQSWLFFFDLNHITPGRSFDAARKAVKAFIASRLQDGDHAGIVAGDKLLNNRLTSVRTELLAALEQVKPKSETRSRLLSLTREWPRFQDEEEAIRVAKNEPEATARAIARAKAEEPDSPPDPESIVRSKAISAQQDAHRAVNQTLASLAALASGLARIPGPKTIVFVSEGFVVQDVDMLLRAVADRTARAGARVYAIDLRGLGRGIGSGILEQHAGDAYTSSPKFDVMADGTNSLAADTGGLLIRNENNFDRAIERIADDASRAYVLTYHAPNTNYDGKFRKIEVRVKRPDVTVRARRGYLAIDPAKMLSPQPVK